MRLETKADESESSCQVLLGGVQTEEESYPTGTINSTTIGVASCVKSIYG